MQRAQEQVLRTLEADPSQLDEIVQDSIKHTCWAGARSRASRTRVSLTPRISFARELKQGIENSSYRPGTGQRSHYRYPDSHCGKELAAWMVEVDLSFIRIWPNHLLQPMMVKLQCAVRSTLLQVWRDRSSPSNTRIGLGSPCWAEEQTEEMQDKLLDLVSELRLDRKWNLGCKKDSVRSRVLL